MKCLLKTDDNLGKSICALCVNEYIEGHLSIFIFALTLAKRETKGESKLPYRTIKNLNSSF